MAENTLASPVAIKILLAKPARNILENSVNRRKSTRQELKEEKIYRKKVPKMVPYILIESTTGLKWVPEFAS